LKTYFAFTGIENSFFSGKSPEESGVWFEFIKSKKSPFKNILLRLFSFNPKIRNYLGAFAQLLKGRTYLAGVYNIPNSQLKYFSPVLKNGLWKEDFFRNKKFVFYKWPLFVRGCGEKTKIKIVPKYENDLGRFFRLINEKNSEVYYTQLMYLDKTMHKFGKSSSEAKIALKEMDIVLNKGVKKFLEENPKGEVFLWSDHGFADNFNFINIEELLPEKKEFIYFIAGTTAHFWFNSKSSKKEVFKKLKKNKRIKILTKNLAKKYQIPWDKRYGELIVFIEKGDYFFPNFYQKSEKEKYLGMHGYPDDSEMNGILISNKKIPKKLKMSEVLEYLR